MNKLFAVFPACCYFWGYSHFGRVLQKMLSTDLNKKIDKSFFAGFVRKMLIIFGDPDCIVLHCLLYFLQHKHPVYNCSDTVMSRPFPHSCEQRHQVVAWVDQIQWFVWNCPPESQPHFLCLLTGVELWERSVRQESYDFCVSPSLLSFCPFRPRTRRQDFWPFLISETRLKFLLWTQGEIGPGNRAS